MTIKQKIVIFLEFVELKTKVASLFPMLAGFLWVYRTTGRIDWLASSLFFIAVICFDMCTTAINNAMDFHKAVDLTYKSQENVIGKYQLNFKRMIQIIIGLLTLSLVFSLALIWLTDPLLLVLGAFCFAIGIGYTYGPMPISRLPLGEVFSGITMGFGIFFLAIYMTAHGDLLASQWQNGYVLVQFHWAETLRIALFSLPFVCLIAGIMLANNTCDLEVDIVNQRFTLVYYLGKQWAVQLYTVLQLVPWLVWLVLCISGQLPWWALIGFSVFPLHWRLIAGFRHKQVKSETFVLAVKSFILFSLMYCIVLGLMVSLG